MHHSGFSLNFKKRARHPYKWTGAERLCVQFLSWCLSMSRDTAQGDGIKNAGGYTRFSTKKNSKNAGHVLPPSLTFRICAGDILAHCVNKYLKICNQAAKQEEQPPSSQIFNLRQEW